MKQPTGRVAAIRPAMGFLHGAPSEPLRTLIIPVAYQPARISFEDGP